MERDELLKILELEHSASNQEIEDAFFMMTKRARNDDSIDLDQVSDAYRKLMNKEKITEEHRKTNIKRANRKNRVRILIAIFIFVFLVVAFTLYFAYCDYFIMMTG